MEIRRRNFIAADAFPYQTPVGAATTTAATIETTLDRRSSSPTTRASRSAARRRPRRAASCAASASPAYIEACGIAPSALVGHARRRAPASTRAARCASTRPAASRSSPARTATARATRRPSPSSCRTARHPDRATSTSSTATPPRSRSAWAPTARARSRSAARRIVKAMDKIVDKAKKIAAHMLEAAEADIEFEDGKFTVAGTDSRWPSARSPCRPTCRTTTRSTSWSRASTRPAFYDPTNFTYPAGCHIAEVEIDPETGRGRDRELHRGATTSGASINPMIVEGQVHGGSSRASARRCWRTASTTARPASS